MPRRQKMINVRDFEFVELVGQSLYVRSLSEVAPCVLRMKVPADLHQPLSTLRPKQQLRVEYTPDRKLVAFTPGP